MQNKNNEYIENLFISPIALMPFIYFTISILLQLQKFGNNYVW